MKLHCDVEVNNRLFATNVIRRRSQRSILVIGKQTVKNTEIHILWQTLQNKQGTKYKVNMFIHTYNLQIKIMYLIKCYLKYVSFWKKVEKFYIYSFRLIII